MCHFTDIIWQDDGMFFCFACNITTHCVLDVNVKGWIVLNEVSNIDVIMKKDWIQPLIGLNDMTFLSMHSKNKLTNIHLLKATWIRDSFSFTSTSEVTSFHEHIEDWDISFMLNQPVCSIFSMNQFFDESSHPCPYMYKLTFLYKFY